MTAHVDWLKQLMHPLGHLLFMECLQYSGPKKPHNDINELHAVLFDQGFDFGNTNDSRPEAPKVIAGLRKPTKNTKKVTLVVPKSSHPLVRALQTSLQDLGIGYDECAFDNDIPRGQDIISVIDFGEPYLYNITEATFRSFVERLSNFKGSMIWVTPAAQMSSDNPNSSMILGMARTIRAELKKDITVVEIVDKAATFSSSSKLLLDIYQSLSYRQKSRTADPDYEFAISAECIKIPRLVWPMEYEMSNQLDPRVKGESSSQTLDVCNTDISKPINFRPDASYVLVGGLGGLGQMISTWMVEQGARSILFLSRNAKEGPETTPFLDELRAQGCEVSTYAGSVTHLPDVEAAIKQATKPVAGVIQMSAVMRVCTSKLSISSR